MRSKKQVCIKKEASNMNCILNKKRKTIVSTVLWNLEESRFGFGSKFVALSTNNKLFWFLVLFISFCLNFPNVSILETQMQGRAGRESCIIKAKGSQY